MRLGSRIFASHEEGSDSCRRDGPGRRREDLETLSDRIYAWLRRAAPILVARSVLEGSSRLLRPGLGSADLPLLARRGIWWTQDLLAVSLTAVFAAVGYHALRLEKEGVDVSDLERIFA